MKRQFLTLAVALSALVAPQTIRAQSSADQNANVAVQITEARKANAALLRQYTWHSRTDVTVEGEKKDSRVELVNYKPDGELQRTVLNDDHAPLPGGPLRKAMAEKKSEEMEKYLTGLKQLLEQYTLPSAGKILDFLNGAKTSGPDAEGLFQMMSLNAVVPGDTLTIWTDAKTKQTRKLHVFTTYQGDSAELTAVFQTLPSGLTYMADAVIRVPTKQMVVESQNFDYSRPN